MRIRRRHALERGEFPKSMQEKAAAYGKGEGAGRSRLRGRRPSPGVTDGSLIQVELIGGQSASSGKGGGSCIAMVVAPSSPRAGSSAPSAASRFHERSLVISCSGARWRACCSSGRFEWARAAQSPPSGDSLDDQRHSAAHGNLLDDDLRQDVFLVYAGLGK